MNSRGLWGLLRFLLEAPLHSRASLIRPQQCNIDNLCHLISPADAPCASSEVLIVYMIIYPHNSNSRQLPRVNQARSNADQVAACGIIKQRWSQIIASAIILWPLFKSL
jgi:hypothetical protein